jgi:hypothetical protein
MKICQFISKSFAYKLGNGDIRTTNKLIKNSNVRYQVLAVASMKMAVFWVTAPYSLIEVY